MASSIRFTYQGQAPSKSNYRHSKSARSRASWKRIVAFREAIGYKALDAWQAAPKGGPGGQGSMLRHSLGKKCEVEVMAVNQRCDAANIGGKDIPDALEGVCFVDDKDVDVIARTVKDDGDAYLQITVRWTSSEGDG